MSRTVQGEKESLATMYSNTEMYEEPIKWHVAAGSLSEQIELDPSDPFDSVISDIIRMNRKKRQDYAADTDPFSNFRDTAVNLGMPGFEAKESALVLLLTKIARLKSLRSNGRMSEPRNESVEDTILDLAVYSIIFLALSKEAKIS